MKRLSLLSLERGRRVVSYSGSKFFVNDTPLILTFSQGRRNECVPETQKADRLVSEQRTTLSSPLWDKRILGLVAENLAQEQFRPLVLRIVKELIWLVSLNNFTFVHKDHAVGDCFCKAHFVGYA